jgi:hypothetical protein
VRIFKAMDANKDGFVTMEKMQDFMRGAIRPASQHKSASACCGSASKVSGPFFGRSRVGSKKIRLTQLPIYNSWINSAGRIQSPLASTKLGLRM